MKSFKKFIILIFLLISSLQLNSVNAETVSVKVPIDLKPIWITCDKTDWSRSYKCTLESWFWSMKNVVQKIIQYFIFITWLLWVLYIIISWIMLSMSWINPNLAKPAKENIIKAIIWVIILLLSWVILNFIAPWVYK